MIPKTPSLLGCRNWRAGSRGAPKRQKWLQQHLFANTSEWPLSSCRPGPVALVSRSGSLSLCKIWRTQMLKFNNNHQSRVECLTKICVWKYFGRRSWSMAGILFSCMVTLCALDTLTGCPWIRVDNRADVCELHSQVRSAESTRHKFARLDRQDREFCFCNQVSKFSFVLMALNAASRTKLSCSSA